MEFLVETLKNASLHIHAHRPRADIDCLWMKSPGQTLNFRGYLQENKRSARVWAESVTAKVIKIAKDKLQLTV